MNEFATSFGQSAAEALPEKRAQFIRKTYMLLAAAILAFVGLEFFIFSTGYAGDIAAVMFGSQLSWLIVLVAFMGVAWIADWWANSQTSRMMQYLGLGVYIVAEAVLFVPLIFIAATYSDATVIPKAGVITLGLFLGITATVFLTKSDFGFLRPIVLIGGCILTAFIFSSLAFGFSLGSVFAFIMVAFAGTAILYYTSNVLHKYQTDQYVAASLTLFASIALLFRYVLTIFSSRD